MSMLVRSLYMKCLTPFALISKAHQQFLRNYSQPVILKMNEAILLHKEGTETFSMSLRYVNPDLNIDRQFNFNRRVNETINYFLRRIDSNINSIVMKKIHRKLKKKRSDAPVEIVREDNVENNNIKFVRNQSILNGDLLCDAILQNSSEIKLVIFNTEYTIKHNVPYVNKLDLPTTILVDFPTYPSKIEGTNVDTAKSSFDWYRSDGERKWVHVGTGYLYVPTKLDLGHKLKVLCIPRNGPQTGPAIEKVSNDMVHVGPGPLPVDNRHAFTKTKLSGKSFRVTSYNILANIYSETSLSKETLYPYCPEYALSMDYRKLLIIKELIGYNTDIICLQEVDRKIYENDLLLSLSEMDYDGVYNSKNDLREGLAMFYNRDRFEKLASDSSVISQGTDLAEFNAVWSRIENEKVKQTFGARNTIVQAVALRSKENAEILVVGNTHLYFLPQADHIRLLQAYYGLVYLQTFAKKIEQENPGCNVSILYCGDFNSVPENAVYQLMTTKFIPEDHGDWKSSAEEHVENVSIKHDLNLSSACGTPEYTNFTNTFSGCLDYIFYQTEHLEVEQVIPMPSNEELTAYTGLPSVVFPSDHISLCADLKWSK